MNPSSGNKGVNGLAQAFVGEIDRRRSKDSALVLDFGEIQGDYSLKTNTSVSYTHLTLPTKA